MSSKPGRSMAAEASSEILAFRIEEVRYIAPLHVYVLPRTLGLFLLGAWVWRTNFFRPTGPRKFLVPAILPLCSRSAAG